MSFPVHGFALRAAYLADVVDASIGIQAMDNEGHPLETLDRLDMQYVVVEKSLGSAQPDFW